MKKKEENKLKPNRKLISGNTGHPFSLFVLIVVVADVIVGRRLHYMPA